MFVNDGDDMMNFFINRTKVLIWPRAILKLNNKKAAKFILGKLNKTANEVEIHYNTLWEKGAIKAIVDFKFIMP